MTQEEKKLLLKDLCARLPYGVKAKDLEEEPPFTIVGFDGSEFIDDGDWEHKIESVKPYLRPMSSMTKKEHEEEPVGTSLDGYMSADEAGDFVDWLLEHHFDYNGLIARGLAIEAPEDMYV